MKTAVLVIDVQQGLCQGEGKAFDCEGESQSGYLEYGTAAWQLATGLEIAASDIRIGKTPGHGGFQ